jgi:dTDP-4-amino-4,6-dideoxygalactose transaminase
MSEIPFERYGELDCAARLAQEEVSLPIHPQLSDEEVTAVVSAVNAWDPQ